MSDVDVDGNGLYDDTILIAIDSLMVKMEKNGLKLIIALHDRDSLGCDSNDAYVSRFKLENNSPTFDCYHKPNDVSLFYNDAAASAAVDARFRHILTHENPNYKNRIWASLSNVIYAIELQNNLQYRIQTQNFTWVCSRAKAVRELITDKILISTGGGGSITNSLKTSYFTCQFIDIVAISSLSVNEFAIINSTSSLLPPLMNQYPQKEIIFNSIGALDNRSRYFSRIFSALNSMQLKWLVWNIVKVPRSNTGYFEFFSEDSCWQVLNELGSSAITNSTTQGSFVKSLIDPNSDFQCNGCLADWLTCVDNIECKNSNSCCTAIFSNGVKKCTPGGC
jgi:hypothetical protein